MWSWVGRLFGTKKAINDIVDKDNGLIAQVGHWIGDMNFTPEERSRWVIDQLKALEPFKIVQRIIALSVMGIWSFIAINVVAAIWVQAYTGVNAVDSLLKLAFSDYVFWPVVSVLSLYVSGGVIPKLVNKQDK